MVKKFDVVIGNPPYQEEAGGSASHNMPIYNLFMDAAYEVGTKVVLITPARFLFNAGYTPKAWNARMLADTHLSVPYYVPDSDTIFPGTAIPGGIAVTYRDANRTEEAVGTFTRFPALNDIIHKVVATGFDPLVPLITSSRSYRYTSTMHEAFPQAATFMTAGEHYKINTKTFDQLSFLYSAHHPDDGQPYVRVFGLVGKKRVTRWARSEYISGPANLGKYKAIVPASRGHLGTLGEQPALIIGEPMLGRPQDAVTQTFITVGSFDAESEADACLKYLKSKFARTMLGVLKVTQHNPGSTWKFVPQQDFTADSDIDWTKSVAEIDQQLYAKYALTPEDIEFIETRIKPME